MPIPLPIALIKTHGKSSLVAFRDSAEWKSSGYQSDIQRVLQDEIFYRAYCGVHGKKIALKEYPRLSKLRWRVWIAA